MKVKKIQPDAADHMLVDEVLGNWERGLQRRTAITSRDHERLERLLLQAFAVAKSQLAEALEAKHKDA